MKRILVFGYGVVVYAIFLATLLYAVGFIGNLMVPKSIDAGKEGPFAEALLIDLVLLAVFALQHSGMARQSVKNVITKIIPQPMERSTYVLFSSLALLLIFWQWRPIGGIIWEVESQLGQILMDVGYAAGWVLVLLTTFVIDHFDLFGLRQVYLYLRRKPYRKPSFVTPGPYRHIRHPLYLGWLCIFWATPMMTSAHFVFAVATTVYVLIAIQLEEKDLLQTHGRVYRNYRQRVPMLLPFGKKKAMIAREALAK